MSDSLLAIIATECKSACAGEPNIEERIFKAMLPVANGHWMVTNEDLCFRGACGGVLLSPDTTDDERRRITLTLDALRALSAALSGIPVDLSAAMPSDPADLLPLRDLWIRAKKGRA